MESPGYSICLSFLGLIIYEGEDKIRNMGTRLSRGTRTKDKERTEDKRLSRKLVFPSGLLLKRTRQRTRRGRRTKGG